MVNSFRTRAAISAGAAMVAALTLVAVPTTHAQNLWGGICTGQNGKWAQWYDQPSVPEAQSLHWSQLCGTGGQRVITFTNCAALAYDGTRFSFPGTGQTQGDAESAAKADLPGGRIVTSGCNGQGLGVVSGNG
jgi:hypothetical protein